MRARRTSAYNIAIPIVVAIKVATVAAGAGAADAKDLMLALIYDTLEQNATSRGTATNLGHKMNCKQRPKGGHTLHHRLCLRRASKCSMCLPRLKLTDEELPEMTSLAAVAATSLRLL